MSIEDLIDNIAAGEYATASATFQDVLAGKVNDALEAHKASIASAMFGDTVGEDEDDDIDIEDEDLYDEEDEDLEEEDE